MLAANAPWIADAASLRDVSDERWHRGGLATHVVELEGRDLFIASRFLVESLVGRVVRVRFQDIATPVWQLFFQSKRRLVVWVRTHLPVPFLAVPRHRKPFSQPELRRGDTGL